MPTFEFTLTRDITESVTVQIQADSIEEAQALAIDNPPATGWEVDDNTPKTAYLPDENDWEEVNPRRYIVADGDHLWGHIFSDETETHCRFVFDTEVNEIITASRKSLTAWFRLTAGELADLEDSLRNANADALDQPETYGLLTSARLPDWAASVTSA